MLLFIWFLMPFNRSFLVVNVFNLLFFFQILNIYRNSAFCRLYLQAKKNWISAPFYVGWNREALEYILVFQLKIV